LIDEDKDEDEDEDNATIHFLFNPFINDLDSSSSFCFVFYFLLF